MVTESLQSQHCRLWYSPSGVSAEDQVLPCGARSTREVADRGMADVQVSTKLKVGVMWDHNGTYMEGFGFQYRDQQIRVELDRMDGAGG